MTRSVTEQLAREGVSQPWIPTDNELPPDGEEVMTKIDDKVHGVRNEQTLIRSGNLWFMPSDCSNPGHQMYVYYWPTHWRFK